MCSTTGRPVKMELCSGWCPARINTGATFVFIINDIVTDIGSNIRLFADDTSVYIIADDPVAAAELLNLDLDKITKWAKEWLVKFNPKKLKVS